MRTIVLLLILAVAGLAQPYAGFDEPWLAGKPGAHCPTGAAAANVPHTGLVPAESLHSYNVQFDRGFLSCEPWCLPRDKWGECIMNASMRAMEMSRWPKLSVAALHYKVEVNGSAHRALPDVRTAWGVFREILRARKAINV